MPSWGSGRADTTLSLRAEGPRGLGAQTPGSPARACPGRLQNRPVLEEAVWEREKGMFRTGSVGSMH